jgi:hypothetical protein
MTLLVREYTYNNFLRKLASECILIEMSGRVGQIKVKAPWPFCYGPQLYSCRNSYGNTVRPNSCRILRCTILQLKQAAESKGQKRLAMRRLKPNRTTDHHKGPMLTHMLSHAHFFTCTQR